MKLVVVKLQLVFRISSAVTSRMGLFVLFTQKVSAVHHLFVDTHCDLSFILSEFASPEPSALDTPTPPRANWNTSPYQRKPPPLATHSHLCFKPSASSAILSCLCILASYKKDRRGGNIFYSQKWRQNRARAAECNVKVTRWYQWPPITSYWLISSTGIGSLLQISCMSQYHCSYQYWSISQALGIEKISLWLTIIANSIIIYDIYGLKTASDLKLLSANHFFDYSFALYPFGHTVSLFGLFISQWRLAILGAKMCSSVKLL